MALLVNLRHLEKGVRRSKGEIPAASLEVDGLDELVHTEGPLRYDIEVQKMEGSLLVRGDLSLKLRCECARCLKPFTRKLELEDWACHVPLEGDEKVAVTSDCVDLTPFIREDIVLELPQHPLCSSGCRGLPKKASGKKRVPAGAGRNETNKSAWSELNKLKF